MMRIIGICGPRESGKSTLRHQLCPGDTDFYHFPFASFLKNMLRAFLLDQYVDSNTAESMLYGELKNVPSRYLCNHTPVEAMQTLGSEWRDTLDAELWTMAWERKIERLSANLRTPFTVVVDDLRFLHEVSAMRRVSDDVTIVRIEREGKGPGAHISEREYLLIAPDVTIVNAGEPEDMLRVLEKWFVEKGKTL